MNSIIRRLGAGLIAGTMAVLLAACGSGSPTTTTGAADKKLLVVTTTTQLADFVRTIGGDHVEVYGIGKPNVDPHDYEPTPADITQIAHADLVVKNGVGLEKWFDSTVNNNADEHTAVVDSSVGISLRQQTPTAKTPDPHIWQSLVNAKIMVANISQALQTAAPQHKDDFVLAERAYDAQIDSTTFDIQQSIASLVNRKIVTDHDALGYFIDEFGLQYVGSVIPSFDSSSDLSTAQVNDLVAKVKAQGVKAVFAEQSLPARAVETLASEANVKVVEGPDAIYSDTLGPSGSDADTYLKMMRHNTDVIVNALR